ncbi:MAG: isoprenylcysteine carboxylmethyltransferase family protein [Verrucomicrobiales bacterium]|jgi:protein-S-isoprenylcysteine O-methyltransferase Ste14|nr:isoprenylcysteine carboxylmethyltransferase family protein [Verrucomicrobiales bacterium]
MSGWCKAVVLLPCNALITLPALVLWLTGWRLTRNDPALLAVGGALLVAGLALAAWTMWLFDRVGKGTAAPWQPPRQLVIRGPYRHVRNPMIVSVLLMALAEALLLNAWSLAAYAAVFWAVNTVYFPLVEEKKLLQRFGDDYARYRRHVPRWLPRLTPWAPPPGDEIAKS